MLQLAWYRAGLQAAAYARQERKTLAELRACKWVLAPVFVLPRAAELRRVCAGKYRLELLRDASQIMSGRVRLFGGSPTRLHLRFLAALMHWSHYELKPSSIPWRKDQQRDLKYVWEPARFGWAFTLGRAYRMTGKPEYAAAFWKHFEAFDRGNPAYVGPNWMSGQEVAIRLIALVWSAQVFADAPSSTKTRLDRLAASVAEHAGRIPSTHMYARSQQNNHSLVEAAGLYTAGAVLGDHAMRARGWSWLNRDVRSQIAADGEYIQHSANYHRLVLQTLLWADSIARCAGDEWPASSMDALRAATRWYAAVVDRASGQTVNLGGNDGAFLLPFGAGGHSEAAATAQAASTAFLGAPVKRTELTVWLGVQKPGRDRIPATPYPNIIHGDNSWAFLRTSANRSRHGHMDQLHLDLWWRGQNIAPDAGTYSYAAAAPWCNSLVATRVHNTVTVDGCDQMTRAGRFLNLDWKPARILKAVPDGVIAAHDAYARLGVRHRRSVRYLVGESWQVDDEIQYLGDRPHAVRLHWLLLDLPWDLRVSANEVLLRLRLGRKRMRIEIKASGSQLQGVDVALVRAGRLLEGAAVIQPVDGWVSPNYGVKLPALSLAIIGASSADCSFTTRFVLPR